MIYLILVTYFAIAGYLFWMATVDEPLNSLEDAIFTALVTLFWPFWIIVAGCLFFKDRFLDVR
jgi:hypothetical protein